MYHQLVLRPEDRPLHRFLWQNLDPSKESEVYEFLRFMFGGCYCPFCAQYTWQQHAEDHREEYPLAAAAVKKNCYMDDLMPSTEKISTAKDMGQQLTDLGDKANSAFESVFPTAGKYWKTFQKAIEHPRSN